MPRAALYFYLAVLLLQLVFLASSWIVAVRAGARVRALSLGLPTVKRFERGGTAIALGLLPFSAHVSFAGLNPLDEDAAVTTLPLPQPCTGKHASTMPAIAITRVWVRTSARYHGPRTWRGASGSRGG
jgi:membrane-associated protease RseP (regulator of RpoE activity)